MGAPAVAWGIAPLLDVVKGTPGIAPPSPSPKIVLSLEDDQFLDDLEQVAFRYFWEQANPATGLVKDRCNVRAPDSNTVASIAATGFGLTALCIGEKRGFIHYF